MIKMASCKCSSTTRRTIPARAGSSPRSGTPSSCRAAEKPLVKIIVLDGNYWEGALTPQEKIAQRRFLEAELKKKTDAPWLWVVNHFPLFSDCSNRPRRQQDAHPRLGKAPSRITRSRSALPATTTRCSTCASKATHASFIVYGAGGSESLRHQTHRPRLRRQPAPRLQPHPRHADELDAQFINADGKCLHHFQRDPAGKVKVLT